MTSRFLCRAISLRGTEGELDVCYGAEIELATSNISWSRLQPTLTIQRISSRQWMDQSISCLVYTNVRKWRQSVFAKAQDEVLCCLQPNDIQFTVTEERSQKIFTFKKLESEKFHSQTD